MKALPLMLAASLVANAAFVTTAAIRAAKESRAADARAHVSSQPSANARPAGSEVSGRDLIAALNADDPAALRDVLRAAGLSDDKVRALVQISIWKRYEARYKALQPKPDPSKPWWKDDPRHNNGWFGSMGRAQRDELRQIQKDQRDEMERLLGPDKTGDESGWQDPRLGFLPPEKSRQLQQIQQDYQELINDVQQDIQGFALPADREKLRYLQEQQKSDMDALLTPEERQAYELRMSQTAQNLRWQMTQFDASEQEYLEIFPLQKAFDEKYNLNDPYGGSGPRDPKFWEARQAAESQLKAQMKQALGEERYNAFVRSQDGDYQQLQAAARRLELPADTATRVYSLRDNVSDAAQKINANAALSLEQKKQAMADLANATRAQVRAALGDAAAEAYFKNNGMGWLQTVQTGNVVTFGKDGNGWSSTPLSAPPANTK